MQELTFAQNYKNNEALRASFFELAAATFDLNFQSWYEHGFWGDRYIPFSYAEGDRVVANVSVNILELLIDGEKKKALQIGTVMTHPDYRGRGLSAGLMNKVLAEYENQYDFMYLYANDTVLDFYPRFGFQPVEERLFAMEYTPSQLAQTGIRKLDIRDAGDLRLIHRLASERLPVSRRFATGQTVGIHMYYCLNVFSEDFYYLEDENAIAVFKQEGRNLDLFDLISTEEAPIHDILSKIAGRDTEQVTFHFTPDYEGINTTSTAINDGLFVKTNGDNVYPVGVKHPVTSIA